VGPADPDRRVVEIFRAAREQAAVNEVAHVGLGHAAVAHHHVRARVVSHHLIEHARQPRAVELQQELAHSRFRLRGIEALENGRGAATPPPPDPGIQPPPGRQLLSAPPARATAACAGPNICTAWVAFLIVTLLKRSVSGFAGRLGATTARRCVKPSVLVDRACVNAAPAWPCFDPMIRSMWATSFPSP